MQTGSSSHTAALYTCFSNGRSNSQIATAAPSCCWRAHAAKPRCLVGNGLQSVQHQQARRLCRQAYTRSDREASIQDLTPILDSVQHVAKSRPGQQAAQPSTPSVSIDSLFPQSHVRPNGILGYLTFLLYFPFGEANTWQIHIQSEHVAAWMATDSQQSEEQQCGMCQSVINLTSAWACRLGFVTFPHGPLGDIVGCGSSMADCQ